MRWTQTYIPTLREKQVEAELVNVGSGGLLGFSDAALPLGERVDVRSVLRAGGALILAPIESFKGLLA